MGWSGKTCDIKSSGSLGCMSKKLRLWLLFGIFLLNYRRCSIYSESPNQWVPVFLFSDIATHKIQWELSTLLGLPGSPVIKNPPARQETQVRSLGWDDFLERAWLPTPVFLPGEFHGQRSLAGYSPRCCKESDTTEVTEHTHTHTRKDAFLRKFCIKK